MKKMIYLILVLVIAAGCTAQIEDVLDAQEEPTLIFEETEEQIINIELNQEEVNINEEAIVEGFTREQIAQNNDATSCFVSWKGQVYDLTQWLRVHPGGANAILPYCGTVEEFEAAYQEQHNRNGARDDGLLRNNPIGVLI